MLFNSFSYLVFLPLILALYWFSPNSVRRVWLLAGSYIFYMSWLPIYGLLLFALTAINFVLGRLIATQASHRKLFLVLAVCLNLGVLAYYKYFSFLLQSVGVALGWYSQGSYSAPAFFQSIPEIILPLGISFFVFEFIHYVVDVYKGNKPINHFLDFALFASFFPSQIAGPIKRYENFVEQLEKEPRFDKTLFYSGLALTVQGLFKKIAVADNLAAVVQKSFSSPQDLSTLDAWSAVICFALQIYFDFSGYTDMGIGAARMLGFKLPPNFNMPYIATSLSDFWKRWHISLSTWLRDYLFIPLGGSRKGRLRTHANLLITMTLGGLWHGAAWHFVVWGAFHGAALIVVHEYERLVSKIPMLAGFHRTMSGKVSSITLTFIAVLVGWVFFRADNMSLALQMLNSMFTYRPGSEFVSKFCLSIGCAGLAFYALFAAVRAAVGKLRAVDAIPAAPLFKHFSHLEYRYVFVAAAFFAALAFAPSGTKAFIYFQF